MHLCGCLYVRLPLLQKRPRLGLPVHSMVCLCAFGLALPVAISLFPQNSQVSTRTRLPPSAHTFSPSSSLCLPWRRLWFKMVFIKLFIHMVTELQTYVLPTTSIPLPPLPSSSPLTLSLPLYTFPRVPDERSQNLHSCPPHLFTPHRMSVSDSASHTHRHLFLSKILQVLALVWIFTSARCFILAFYDSWSVSFDCEKCSRLERHGTLLILIGWNILNILMT